MNIYDIKTRTYNELSQGYYPEKEYICPLCDFTCHEAFQMKNHLKKEHKIGVKASRYGKSSSKGHTCPLCGFTCGNEEDMDRHVKAEHPDGVEKRFYFYKLTGRYICLHCDYTCSDAAEMELHQKEVHLPNEESLFIQLLTADSAFVDVLSYAEKMTLLYAYYGMSNVDIARTLGISPNTVGTNLNRFLKREAECKTVLKMIEMLRIENAAELEMPDDRIPGLDSEGNVKGFYNKDRLHDPTDPIPHASVILLVAQKDSEGQMRFLICTKSSQMLTRAAITEKTDSLLPFADEAGEGTLKGNKIKKRWVDFQGGQCEQIDAAIEIGKPLPDDIFINAAAREYKEEIRVKAVGLKSRDSDAASELKARSMDVSNMQYLYTDQVYRSQLDPVGLNTETTRVYLKRLPDDLPPSSILVRDEWTDSMGGKVKQEYPSEFVTWEELEQFSISEDTVLMEGARRVVDRMKRDPELKKKMFELLENSEA